jgi:hypothetical protein
MKGKSEVIYLAGKTRFPLEARGRGHKKLCHNCDTKPVQPTKIDFIDDKGLLILRKLQKAKERPANPAYRPVRHFLASVQFCEITPRRIQPHREHQTQFS